MLLVVFWCFVDCCVFLCCLVGFGCAVIVFAGGFDCVLIVWYGYCLAYLLFTMVCFVVCVWDD